MDRSMDVGEENFAGLPYHIQRRMFLDFVKAIERKLRQEYYPQGPPGPETRYEDRKVFVGILTPRGYSGFVTHLKSFQETYVPLLEEKG